MLHDSIAIPLITAISLQTNNWKQVARDRMLIFQVIGRGKVEWTKKSRKLGEIMTTHTLPVLVSCTIVSLSCDTAVISLVD